MARLRSRRVACVEYESENPLDFSMALSSLSVSMSFAMMASFSVVAGAGLEPPSVGVFVCWGCWFVKLYKLLEDTFLVIISPNKLERLDTPC